MTLSRAVAWRHERLGEPGDLTADEQAVLGEKFRVLSVKQRKRIYGPTPRVNAPAAPPSLQPKEE
jgi:tRNA (guanosine-2'-O-)-methyltransferase